MWLFSCASQYGSEKLNGLSLVASRDTITEKQVERILNINANSVALMPYAFMRDKQNPELAFNMERQWFGERAKGIEHTILMLKNQDLEIMIKPHIWLRNGDFTGDLKFSDETDWEKFENSYREYLLMYAKIAEKHQVELFCIGTELYNFVVQRPQFWKELISDLRKIYHGKLVYAENWDKVYKVNLWEELDYIGVDAYFPLTSKISPTEDEIRIAWKKHISMLKDVSSKHDKQIIFTEYGYRSMDYALKEPWDSNNISNTNHNLQAQALKVLYEEFWTQNWFAGGYLWKWHQHEKSGGLENNRFTPQNKPAENTVKEYYQKFRN